MTIQTAPVVGMHFRPPAKVLIAHLPVGFPLRLKPEPTNPYDPNAIQVWIDGALIPESQYEELKIELPGMGFDLSEVLTEEWHLGYIAKERAAEIINTLELILIEHKSAYFPAILTVAGNKYFAEFSL